MFKSVAAALFGFVIAFVAMFVGNPGYFKAQSQVGIPSLEDGQYTAYSIKPMYDRHTGEPVYWVVGGKGRMMPFAGGEVYIEPNEVRLYSIPRSKITGLPANANLGNGADSFVITVADGRGHAVARR